LVLDGRRLKLVKRSPRRWIAKADLRHSTRTTHTLTIRGNAPQWQALQADAPLPDLPVGGEDTRTPVRMCRSSSAPGGGSSRPRSIASFSGLDMISQLKCAAASCGSSISSTPRAARRSKVSASAAIVRPGAALVEERAELREAAGLRNHEPAQRQQPRLHHTS